MEVIASSNGGDLRVQLNAAMLDTVLTNQVSSNVVNEIQTVEITSTITFESFVNRSL